MAALQHNASHCQEERREFRCDYCSSVKSDATVKVVVRFFISIFVPYFTIIHATIIIAQLHGIFNIVFYNFHLLLLQHGPPFFLKVGVQFCSPKTKIKIIEYP